MVTSLSTERILSLKGGQQSSNGIESTATTTKGNILPRFDGLDKKLLSLSLPAILNFAILPLVGAVDLFWVGRMSNPLALAGQAAANQVFSSAFWIISFLPSVAVPLISRYCAEGNKEMAEETVSQSMILGIWMGMIGSGLLFFYPKFVLSSVLAADSAAYEYALPYLRIRALSFVPALLSTVGFAAFRGSMDTVTPLKISLFSNTFNAALDPVFIFFCKLGVSGAALATVSSEVIAFLVYFVVLVRRGLLKARNLVKAPSFTKLKPLLVGGAAVQLRSIALNIVFLSVTRATQGLDKTGVAASAHSIAINVFQIGGVVLLALSTVAAFLVPSVRAKEGDVAAKNIVNRMMGWGTILGSVLGAVQLGVIPLLRVFTPIAEIQEAAKMPSIISSFLQIINGCVFIGEGVMQGTGSFLQLALSNIVACVGMIFALRRFTASYGLVGVWMSFGVFNGLRLLGVINHQLFNGPLSNRKLAAAGEGKGKGKGKGKGNVSVE